MKNALLVVPLISAGLLAAGCAALSWHLIEKPALRAKPIARVSGETPLATLKQVEII